MKKPTFLKRIEPFLVLLLIFGALLQIGVWVMKSATNDTSSTIHNIANLAVFIIGIPHLTLLFKDKQSLVLSMLFSLSVLVSAYTYWA